MLNDQSVSLALCNRCFQGWFGPMPTSDTLKGLKTTTPYNPALIYQSCYQLAPLIYPENYALKATQKCEEIGVSLVSIETEAEWDFLNTHLFWNCNLEMDCSKVLRGVFIGLRRNTKSLGKRFRWINERPLVYNKWYENHPAGGYVHGCGFWDFNFNWIDVGCGSWIESSAALCEWSKAFNAEVVKLPLPSLQSAANTNSATTRGLVAICKDDTTQQELIVPHIFRGFYRYACALYVNNTGRLKLVNVPLSDDLMYSCGEVQSGQIYFSEVCDQTDNCLNKKDEIIDMCNPPGYQENARFACKSSGRTLPLETQCDLFTDCDDNSDEENCETCQFGLCPDGSCVPQPWLTDEETDCVSLYARETNDLYNSVNAVEDCAFLCNVSKCVPWSKLGNGVVDCLGPEGPLDETLGAFERSSCGNTSTLEWAPKCIYQKDRLGEMIGCRNMHHLNACQDFVCPEGYLKCPRAYCIPSHYVGNGEYDCLLGEDETLIIDNFSKIPSGYYLCMGVRGFTFLHPDRICDGSKDCVYGFDELECHVTCSAGFLCVSGFLVIDDYDRSQPLTNISFIDPRTRMIDFSGFDASLILEDLCKLDLTYLLDLRLSKCSITDWIVDRQCFPRLSKLDMSHNLLRNISMAHPKRWPIYYMLGTLRFLNLSYNVFLENFDAVAVASNHRLEVLDLSHTAIMTFPDMYAISLTLTHLNLSHTRITKLATLTFPQLHKPWYLDVLDLRSTHIQVVEQDAFKGLKIRSHLHSDFFKLCCPHFRGIGIPEHSCHAPSDPLSSCSNLLDNRLLTMLMWIMGTTAVFCNSGNILLRFITNRKTFSLPYAQFVTQLGVSDFCMGVYLLIISFKALKLEEKYVLHDLTWRESRLCRAAGALATLSTEASISLILFLTIERYFDLKHSNAQRCMRPRTVFICSILAWGLGLIFAVVPLVPGLNHWEVYSGNSVCLGLPLLSEKRSGWQFTTGVFIAYNGLLCLGTFFGQLAIYRATSVTRKMTEGSDSDSQDGNLTLKLAQNLNLNRRLATIAITDLLARLLISVLGLYALAGHDLGREAFAWVAVFVMPINSAVNPILYSLPILRQRLTKSFAKFFSSRSKPRQRTQDESRL